MKHFLISLFFIAFLVLQLEAFLPSGKGCSELFKKQFLRVHNAKRALHGVPPLVFNDTISAGSQKYADYMADIGKMKHRMPMHYGQNIFLAYGGSAPDGIMPVEHWYSEIKNYDFVNVNVSNYNRWPHFSQLVWKGSRQLGVGCSYKNDKYFVFGEYYPIGNVALKGVFMENVLPPLKNSTKG